MEDGIVRKAGLAMKASRSELAKSNVQASLEGLLAENPDDVYTVAGILVELFGVAPTDLKGPWGRWPGGLPALYGRVRRALDRLYEADKVTRQRRGRALFWGISP